jgi:hypothetical protein
VEILEAATGPFNVEFYRAAVHLPDTPPAITIQNLDDSGAYTVPQENITSYFTQGKITFSVAASEIESGTKYIKVAGKRYFSKTGTFVLESAAQYMKDLQRAIAWWTYVVESGIVPGGSVGGGGPQGRVNISFASDRSYWYNLSASDSVSLISNTETSYTGDFVLGFLGEYLFSEKQITNYVCTFLASNPVGKTYEIWDADGNKTYHPLTVRICVGRVQIKVMTLTNPDGSTFQIQQAIPMGGLPICSLAPGETNTTAYIPPKWFAKNEDSTIQNVLVCDAPAVGLDFINGNRHIPYVHAETGGAGAACIFTANFRDDIIPGSQIFAAPLLGSKWPHFYGENNAAIVPFFSSLPK